MSINMNFKAILRSSFTKVFYRLHFILSNKKSA
jgi:hypothetical protein